MKALIHRLFTAYLTWAGVSLGLVAQGLSKQTVIKKQTALGTPATGAGGQILRRENSVFTLTKATYESTEIVSHQQSTGTRMGLQATTGKVAGLLSPATYKLFMASALRKDFVAGINSGAQVNITAAVTTGAAGTFTRGAGSYLTDGFKVGDVVRWTGWTTTGAPNNAHNFWITSLSALVMTVVAINGVAVGAKAAGDSVTATVVGKKTLAPMTGHTDDLFTVDEWYPDAAQVETFTDLKLNQMTLDLPASGNAKASFDLVGLKRILGTAQTLTTPTVETTTPILAAVTGLLYVNGVPTVNVTGVQISVAEGLNADGPVVGSDFSPDISRSRIKVTGSFSSYFSDQSLTALFQVETALSLMLVLAADSTAAADFIAITLGRIKLNGDSPDDGEKGILRTLPFTAEINQLGGTGTSADQTIMAIQDSAA